LNERRVGYRNCRCKARTSAGRPDAGLNPFESIDSIFEGDLITAAATNESAFDLELDADDPDKVFASCIAFGTNFQCCQNYLAEMLDEALGWHGQEHYNMQLQERYQGTAGLMLLNLREKGGQKGDTAVFDEALTANVKSSITAAVMASALSFAREDLSDLDLNYFPRPFPLRMESKVISGFGRGSRQLGWPTANMDPNAPGVRNVLGKLAKGVYFGAARVEGDSENRVMVMNVGNRPTFEDGDEISVEVHVVHKYPQDFYGKQIKVLVLGAIRGERKFESIQALISRIDLDVSIAKLMPAFKPYKVLLKDPSLAG